MFFFLEEGSLIGAYQFSQAGWPVGSRKPPCPPPQSCEYRRSLIHLALCMDAGDLNSGPSDCRESTLLSKRSPYSSQTILILCDEMLLLRLMHIWKKKSWLSFSFSLSLFGGRLEPRTPIYKQLLPILILKALLAPSWYFWFSIWCLESFAHCSSAPCYVLASPGSLMRQLPW